MYTLEETDMLVQKAINSLEFNKEPHNLYLPIEYILSIGGKRIRPRLCLAAYSLFSDTIDKPVIDAAIALEIYHNFTLIHDDIMDRAETRRKVPTVHKKWNENIAILSGDLMSILAFEYLAGFRGKKQNEVFKLFVETAARVCEGQQFDMEYEDLPFISMEDYIHMIELKTASLIACSAKMGALMADAPTDTCNALHDYAYFLGIAFQIADDYLDTYGDAGVFGKKIGGDIAVNKKTWLLTECFRSATKEQKEDLNALLLKKNDYSEEKYKGVVAIYNALGLREKALEQIASYEKKAMEIISGIGLDRTQMEYLNILAKQLTYREK